MLNQKYILRPSVSVIPIDKEKSIYQFFLSNTRQKILLQLANSKTLDLILSLDGKETLGNILNRLGYENEEVNKIQQLIQYLYDKKIIEIHDSFLINNQDKYRRVLNLIADFVPSLEIENVWQNIQTATVIIVGVGAIGGWVADFLVSMGVQHFVFIDDDSVGVTNLNRSIYTSNDIGKLKADTLDKLIKSKNHLARIKSFYNKVLSDTHIEEALLYANTQSSNVLVINCGDYPNVDTTSAIINRVCMKSKTPYIIAGGYNLHLSLIGNTVIPFQSACFECIKASLNEANAHELEGLVKLQRPDRNIGSLAPLAIVSASMAANEAIRVLSKSKHFLPAMTNRRGEFNFLHNRISYIEFTRRIDCKSCGVE